MIRDKLLRIGRSIEQDKKDLNDLFEEDRKGGDYKLVLWDWSFVTVGIDSLLS